MYFLRRIFLLEVIGKTIVGYALIALNILFFIAACFVFLSYSSKSFLLAVFFLIIMIIIFSFLFLKQIKILLPIILDRQKSSYSYTNSYSGFTNNVRRNNSDFSKIVWLNISSIGAVFVLSLFLGFLL